MADKKKKTDNRRRCPSCKARKVPTVVDALEMCGACGLVLPIVEKQGKPLIEVLSEEENKQTVDDPNPQDALAEVMEGTDTTGENKAMEDFISETFDKLPEEVQERAKEMYPEIKEAPPVETQSAAESRTRKRVARLDCVPMGTHFRTGNGYVGILMDVNESFAKVNSVRIGERKREIQTWSPATEVQVISEQEFRDLARSGTDEADTMAQGNTTQTVEGENMAKTEAKAAALKVPAEAAAAILIALGVKTVTVKTPVAQLGTKLKSIISKAEDKDALQVDDDNQQSVLTEIIEAVVSKQGIEILPATAPAKAEKGDKEAPKKKEKKGEGKVKAETNGHAPRKERKPRETSGAVDKFGTREGTEFAALNKALGKKPLSVRELVEKAGIKPKLFNDKLPQMGSYYGHLKKLSEKGFVVKSENGYALAGK